MKFLAGLGNRIVLVAALFLSLPVVPAFTQARIVHVVPAFAVSSAGSQLPKGTKIVARVALDGQPVTRMYTQSEYGRTYLYIEHDRYSFTTVDISKKQHPQVVNHRPGNIEPEIYDELFEGGSVEASPSWEIKAGVDSNAGSGMRSTLQQNDPDDGKLLVALGAGYANLADREHRLVFFASPSQLLVIRDNRLTAMDFITN
jgi:hypothetical protein